MPASIILTSMSTSQQAGPRVQMILVRRLETSMVSKMLENLILEESYETGFEESTIVFVFWKFVDFWSLL